MISKNEFFSVQDGTPDSFGKVIESSVAGDFMLVVSDQSEITPENLDVSGEMEMAYDGRYSDVYVYRCPDAR